MTQVEDIRILVFEDNDDFGDGLAQIISLSQGFECVGRMPHPVNVLKEVEQYKPHVVLMDIDMPMMSGIEALRLLRSKGDKTLVIMLTGHDETDNIIASIEAGANGYLLKETSPQKILANVKEVLDGGAPMTGSVARRVLSIFSNKGKKVKEVFDLTDRETEILSHLVKGMSKKMIADKCSISYHTVNAHILKIYEKMEVKSATEAVAKASKHNML